MSRRDKCSCQSCTIRSFIGPAMVMAVGVLWLLHEIRGGILYWGNTWPVLLIVPGILLLASSMASRAGHVDALPPPGVPPAQTPSSSQTPYSPQGQ